MGQQQLLLLVLGILVVGLAVVGGVEQFQHHQEDHMRDSMVEYGLELGNRMATEKMKPHELGGLAGGRWEMNIFHKVAGVEEGQFVDTPYGKMAFRFNNHAGHLIGWPESSSRREVVVIRVYQRNDRGATVKPSGKTWMGKKRWLVRAGLMNPDGSFKIDG